MPKITTAPRRQPTVGPTTIHLVRKTDALPCESWWAGALTWDEFRRVAAANAPRMRYSFFGWQRGAGVTANQDRTPEES